MNQIKDFIQVKELIMNAKTSLILISSNNCGVCDSVEVKLDNLLEKFSSIETAKVKVDDTPEVSGEYLVFTVPTILFFVEGKEVIRESRFIQFDRLERQLDGWISGLE